VTHTSHLDRVGTCLAFGGPTDIASSEAYVQKWLASKLKQVYTTIVISLAFHKTADGFRLFIVDWARRRT